jgi:tetratricopeptide (TPR) repeat protein
MTAFKVLPIELKVILGPAKGEKKRFTQDLILVGRNPDNDFCLGSDQKVSRTHLEIHVGFEKVIVRNISQRNFMLVSGKEVNEAILKPGEIIFIGESQIQVNFELPEQKKTMIQSQIPALNQNNLSQRSEISLTENKLESPLVTNSSQLAKPNQKVFSGGGYNFSDMKEANSPPSKKEVKKNNTRKMVPILLVVTVAIVTYIFLFSGDKKKSKKNITLRTNVTAVQNIQQSIEALEAFNKEEAPKRTLSYEQAQQQYLKGFRDYRNGNYSRAMEHFAAALAFYPEHDQAKRYYHLAKRKNEEFAQYHFNLGKRYYGIQNYRLCSAHFAIVIRSKRDEKDPIRQEALQYYRECEARQVGRY